MTRSPGRAPCGKRLVDAVPHGHWRTEAFIGTLRRDGRPNCSFEAAINGEIFPVDNEQIIVPKLRSCDILYCRRPAFTTGARETVEGGRRPAFICAYIRNVDFA